MTKTHNSKRKHRIDRESSKQQQQDGGAKNRMRLAVFDLDYTIWQPEMYQLNGAPKLTPIDSKHNKRLSATALEEARTDKEGHILTDRQNTPMRVFRGASYALAEIEQMKLAGFDIQAAIASKTDEPSWARICMNHLVIDSRGTRLMSCFGSNARFVEIAFGSKKEHLKRLHKKTGIAFEDMAFFDNEYGNIRSVSMLGVKCYYTPNGMTKEDWEKAKADFGVKFDVWDAEVEDVVE